MRRSARAWLAGLLCAIVLGAAPGLVAFFHARPSRPPNLVLVTLDTVRADHLSAYGYPRPTSPALAGLAARGARFERAFATAPWTAPSLFSVVTGKYAQRHGVTDWGMKLSPGLETLASVLRRNGYRTALFNNHPVFFDLHAEIRQGFDQVLSVSDQELPAARLVDRVIQWLDGSSSPFFVWIHLFDPHEPFAPPPPYDELFSEARSARTTAIPIVEGGFGGGGIPRYLVDPLEGEVGFERLVSAYDAEIRYTDDQLGRFLDALERRGLTEGTLVALTADHGEILERAETPFHETVYFSHGTYLFEELLHVPFVLRYPGAIAPGTIVERPVSLVDLAPTILELLELPGEPGMDGASLAPLLRGESRPALPVLSAELRNGWSAIRWNDYKLIDYDYGRLVLYDLKRDPGERRDIAAEQPGMTRRLHERLQQATGSPGGEGGTARPSLDEETRRKLRALGYLSESRE